MRIKKFFSSVITALLGFSHSCIAMNLSVFRPADSMYYQVIQFPKELSQEDFYATDPKSVELLLKELKRDGVNLPKNIHEPACGQGNISKMLKKNGYNVFSSDLHNHGYGIPGIDFLKSNMKVDCFFIHPPSEYKVALEFAQKAIDSLNPGGISIIYSDIRFITTIKRREFFKQYPPKYVYIHSKRQSAPKNGDFEKYGTQTTMNKFVWYVWEKGFKGEPTIRWIDSSEPILECQNSQDIDYTKPFSPDHYIKPYNEKKLHCRIGLLHEKRQKDDFYATNPQSVMLFLNKLKKDGINLPKNIHEPACGQGHISKVLEGYGHKVYSSNLHDYGYGTVGVDFLKSETKSDCFFTNPPYKLALEFVERSIMNLNKNGKSIMYLTLDFLAGKERSRFFKLYPPKYIYVHSKTQNCFKDGNSKNSVPNYYAWYIWEKDANGELFHGEPTLRWID